MAKVPEEEKEHLKGIGLPTCPFSRHPLKLCTIFTPQERCTPAGTNPLIYIGIVYSDDWLSDCKPPGTSHFGESIRKPLGSTEYEFNIMSCVDTDSAAPTILAVLPLQ
jgi:hypothetical protein